MRPRYCGEGKGKSIGYSEGIPAGMCRVFPKGNPELICDILWASFEK